MRGCMHACMVDAACLLACVVCAQTDPNWSNFLYDAESDTLNLIDFGGECRCFFCEIVRACAFGLRGGKLGALMPA